MAAVTGCGVRGPPDVACGRVVLYGCCPLGWSGGAVTKGKHWSCRGGGGANCLADGLAGFRGLPGGHGDDVLQRPRPARDLECCWAEYR